ncbi:protein wnt [Plakobranchus ocellatus]|uniref:Protein Wnt n=1 Tax=Plakobranchus ocellatus TaxID=259542 RepID=A0AAV4C2K5_9GAST|nr:protein wnt [Plakobranchus ocellatus]
MSSLAHISDKDNCEKLSGLVKRQRRICRSNIELMDSVRVGALMAIEECQSQFKYRRWNCSTENTAKLFGNVILKQVLEKKNFLQEVLGNNCVSPYITIAGKSHQVFEKRRQDRHAVTCNRL